MKDQLKNISITIGACVAIISGLSYLFKGSIDTYINNLVVEYHASPGFKYNQRENFKEFIKGADFELLLNKLLKGDKTDEHSGQVLSLQRQLSIRLGIPEDQVMQELAKLIQDIEQDQAYRERLKNCLRLLNTEYPDAQVWVVD